MFDLSGPVADPLADLEGHWSMWRYRGAMPPCGASWAGITLGEGMTPLVELAPGVLAKMEQVSPTGSFKDRGVALILALARSNGEQVVVADSSGNAGRSVAAYAARAGMSAEIYVPDGTPEAKTAAARGSGALVVTVAGGRQAAADAALRRVESGGCWYANHVFQAAFVHGVKTVAYEIFEQLGGASPGCVVVPAGNGSLVQGVWLGFSELAAARGAGMPRIVAAQSDRFALLAGRAPSGEATAASGIAIPAPPRAPQVRAAVVASGGRVSVVDEGGIAGAQEDLARRGIVVEPTAAVGWAAAQESQAGSGPVVAILTGR